MTLCRLQTGRVCDPISQELVKIIPFIEYLLIEFAREEKYTLLVWKGLSEKQAEQM